MSEYRIKKGGREFTATRLETLQELIARGLLRGRDPVAIDGGPFRPASEHPELASCLPKESKAPAEAEKVKDEADSSDPFRHFSGLTIDESDADSDSHLLSSFLGQLSSLDSAESPEAPEPPLPPEPPVPAERPAPPRRVVRPEPDPPPAPARSALGARPEAKGTPPPPVVEPEARPAPPPAPPPSRATAGEARDSDQEKLPVSFRQWLEEKGDEESPLSRFGRYDEGLLSTETRVSGGFNLVRVLLVLVVGLMSIGTWYVYIHTAASTEFPLESTLAERIPGAAAIRRPSTVLQEMDLPSQGVLVPVEPDGSDKEALLQSVRGKLRGGVEDFANSEGLEDALFRELTNFGAMPIGVSVSPLQERGSADRYAGRPTQASLEISLGAISEQGDAGYEILEERLILSWLLVGKYQTLGKVRFEDVQVRVQPPLAWDKRYQGRRLAAFWDGQVDVEQLFIPQN